MDIDWPALEREYVERDVTYTALARTHGVSRAAVAHHGVREGWVAKRRAYLRGGGPGKTPREPAAALGETGPAPREPAVDGAALRSKLLALADNWTDRQGGQIEDVGDYRRMVQSVLDLTRAAGEDAAPELRVVMDVPEAYGE